MTVKLMRENEKALQYCWTLLKPYGHLLESDEVEVRRLGAHSLNHMSDIGKLRE